MQDQTVPTPMKCTSAHEQRSLCRNHLLTLQPLLLLGEDLAAHLEDALKALAAPNAVLVEACDECVFDAVAYPLPATAEGCDPRALAEESLAVGERRVHTLLLHGDQVAPCQVLAHHGEGLICGVDVAGLVDVALIYLAADGLDPFWRGLLAADETLGSEDAGGGIDGA